MYFEVLERKHIRLIGSDTHQFRGTPFQAVPRQLVAIDYHDNSVDLRFMLGEHALEPHVIQLGDLLDSGVCSGVT